MAELEIVRTKERVRVLEEVVKQQPEALKEGSRLLVKCRPIRSPPSCRKTCLVRNTSDARVSTTECTHNVPSSNTIPNRHEFFASIVNRKTHFSNGKRRRYRSCHERIFYLPQQGVDRIAWFRVDEVRVRDGRGDDDRQHG